MKLPFDVRALWERAQRWYRDHSERDQRIILGVLVAAGLSAVYVGIVEPVLDFRKGIAQEIADGQEELERSMRFLAAKDTRHAEREELRKRLTQAKSRLLPGGTATLGAAALQERANALASEKGIAVQSTQVMKEETVDPFRRVAIRLSLSGELKPLAELLAGLEYTNQLSVPFIEVSRRGAVAGAKGPRTLSATIEVAGFVQGGAKGPEGDAGAKVGEGEAGTKTGEGEAGTKAGEGEAAKGADGEAAGAGEGIGEGAAPGEAQEAAAVTTTSTTLAGAAGAPTSTTTAAAGAAGPSTTTAATGATGPSTTTAATGATGPSTTSRAVTTVVGTSHPSTTLPVAAVPDEPPPAVGASPPAPVRVPDAGAPQPYVLPPDHGDLDDE